MQSTEIALISYFAIGAALIGAYCLWRAKSGAADTAGKAAAFALGDPLFLILALVAWPLALVLLVLRYDGASWAVKGSDTPPPKPPPLPACRYPSAPPPPPTSR